jgi:hypothetical protein
VVFLGEKLIAASGAGEVLTGQLASLREPTELAEAF